MEHWYQEWRGHFCDRLAGAMTRGRSRMIVQGALPRTPMTLDQLCASSNKGAGEKNHFYSPLREQGVIIDAPWSQPRLERVSH